MQVNKTNNVIFLKNVESNIIKEAFVILKDNVRIKESEEKNSNTIKKINILKEAELLINQKIIQSKIEYDKFKINRLEKKIRLLKIINIVIVVSFITYIGKH